MVPDISSYLKKAVMAHTVDIVEGGDKYTEDKDDNGGATRWGVIQKTALKYKSAWGKFNWDGNMRTMPREFAIYVCEAEFWTPMSLDEIEAICPILSGVMFDIAYNMGVGRVAPWLQEILNAQNNSGTLYPDIAVDGKIGKGTINALKAFYKHRGIKGISRLTYAITAFQTRFYYDIVKNKESQEKWMYGWAGRAGNSYETYVPLFLKLQA